MFCVCWDSTTSIDVVHFEMNIDIILHGITLGDAQGTRDADPVLVEFGASQKDRGTDLVNNWISMCCFLSILSHCRLLTSY